MTSVCASRGHLGADPGPCPWKMTSAVQFSGFLGYSFITCLWNKCSEFRQLRRVSKALLSPGRSGLPRSVRFCRLIVLTIMVLFLISLSEETVSCRWPSVPGWILVSSEVFYFFNLLNYSLQIWMWSFPLQIWYHHFYILFSFSKINCKNLLSKKQVFNYLFKKKNSVKK